MAGFWKDIKKHFYEDVFERLRRSKRLHQLVDVADFALPLRAWNATGNVLLSILFASLLINILSLAFPLALLQIYDRIIPNVAINTLIVLATGVFIALLLEAVLKVTRNYVGAWADAKFEHIIGCQGFKRLMDASLMEIESEGAGVHVKRLNALNTLRDFYAGQAITSLIDLPFVIVLLALIAYIAGWLVFVPILMLSLFLYLAVKNSKKLKEILDARRDEDDRRMNYIIETLSNIHTVKSISMEAQMQRRYERLQRSSSVHDHNVSMESAKATGMGMSLSQLTLIAVVAFGSLLVMKGHLTIGGLAACTLLSGRCLQPINTVVGLWTRMQSIKIAREDLDKLLSMPIEDKATLPNMPTLKGEIELRNVSFQYPGSDAPLFENINLKIKAKEAIALSGEGLSGKSTLVELLMGMLRPTSGEILLDGNDSSEFNARSFRQQFAYLPQVPRLFNGTIMENLSLFREERFYDQAVAAAKAAGLAPIIEQLPQGYDTMVADQAIEALPRGMIQRIAIARALLFRPAILIFDEANTAMDMRGDAVVHDMLSRIHGKCTMIVISHRPSILNLVQRKVVLTPTGIKDLV